MPLWLRGAPDTFSALPIELHNRRCQPRSGRPQRFGVKVDAEVRLGLKEANQAPRW